MMLISTILNRTLFGFAALGALFASGCKVRDVARFSERADVAFHASGDPVTETFGLLPNQIHRAEIETRSTLSRTTLVPTLNFHLTVHSQTMADEETRLRVWRGPVALHCGAKLVLTRARIASFTRTGGLEESLVEIVPCRDAGLILELTVEPIRTWNAASLQLETEAVRTKATLFDQERGVALGETAWIHFDTHR